MQTVNSCYVGQRCNRGEMFGATSAMVGQNLPPWLK